MFYPDCMVGKWHVWENMWLFSWDFGEAKKDCNCINDKDLISQMISRDLVGKEMYSLKVVFFRERSWVLCDSPIVDESKICQWCFVFLHMAAQQHPELWFGACPNLCVLGVWDWPQYWHGLLRNWIFIPRETLTFTPIPYLEWIKISNQLNGEVVQDFLFFFFSMREMASEYEFADSVCR